VLLANVKVGNIGKKRHNLHSVKGGNMSKSKVYFTNLRVDHNTTILEKLAKLVKKAGMLDIDFKDKYTAIKIHLGEPGNLGYLRPNYAKVIVDLIKGQGGKVFLTDCNTLYVGRRKNALDHLEAAYENGYNPFATGCHVIIADGLKGSDEALVPVDGEYVKVAKIGRAVMDAEIIVSMNHFKGHESTGFGGAIKNIGMGCGSRAGKMEMHSQGKPFVREKKCRFCRACARECAHGAISYNEKGLASIDHNKCVGCGRCISACNFNAISPTWDEANDVLNYKMAEYAKAVLNGRPHFHINFVIDVSPACDCMTANDMPIVPDVGFFASFDPVALDMACVDAVNRQKALEGSVLAETIKKNGCCGGGARDGAMEGQADHFATIHPDTNWQSCLQHSQKIGLGSMEYELIEV